MSEDDLPTTKERLLTIMSICDVSLNTSYEEDGDLDIMLDAIIKVATYGSYTRGVMKGLTDKDLGYEEE